METIPVVSLKEKTMYNADILVCDDFVALPAGVVVTNEFIRLVSTWGYKELLCAGTISLDAVGAESDLVVSDAPKAAPKDKTDFVQNLKSVFEESEMSMNVGDDEEKIAAVENIYEAFQKYIEHVYTYYATHLMIKKAELSDSVILLSNFVKAHKKYIMLAGEKHKIKGHNFLILHSLRSTILALIIAHQLRIENDKIRELGVACVLHEIGMIKIPPQLYVTDKKLSVKEHDFINTHTILGYNILKELEFPLNIQLAALEHHEKENGFGYPHRLAGEKISIFAKIISVACTFEAITAPRSYKEEQTAFEAMMTLLKNPTGQYDAKIIKALLAALSLYPIGTYVFLSNGKIAQVTDVSIQNIHAPTVKLLTEKDENGKCVSMQTDNAKLKISRVLNKKEVDDVLKTLSAN